MSQLLLCVYPVHLSPSSSSPKSHQGSTEDPSLKERTVLPVEDITLPLDFCLKNTYFSFQGQFRTR